MRTVPALAAAVLLLAAAPAGAITYGSPDGEGHPQVGSLLAPEAYDDGTWTTCSGTLISPTVFLTAAHCDQGLARVRVTFDSVFVAPGTTYEGDWHADPDYRNATGDPRDIAVVVFDAPVQGIEPAHLPEAGSLARLRGGTQITSVGYGAQAVTKGHGPKQFSYSDVRYVSTGSLTTVTKTWLKASMNPAHGDGGTCYGDSGGPNFLRTTDIVAGTTITGDSFCRSTNVDLRMDTRASRAFLGRYVTLP